MNEQPVLIIGFFLLFLFGLVSRLADRSPITGPMVFLAAGVLIGPVGFNLIDIDFDAPTTQLIAEITLIIILFVDASRIHVTRLAETLVGIPSRLLLLGLPLTMLFGFIFGWIVYPQMNLWLIALVAFILSPTDAALGQAVVSSENVPPRIRQSITIESGLNDGIALPLVLLAITVLSDVSQPIATSHWLTFIIKQLAFGPVIGAIVGLIGGKLIDYAVAHNWIEPVFQSLAAISIALLAYVSAEAVQGNGFIAAFFAGLLLGTKIPEVRRRIQDFGEAEGQMLSLFVFLSFGFVAVPAALPYIDMRTILYAILSLTIIRMVPVALVLHKLKLPRFDVIFIGWFGPRGIASTLYLIIAMGTLGDTGYEQAAAIIVTTVTMSTFLHGISAVPMSNMFPTLPDNKDNDA